MKTFHLYREEDVTGVSGTGVVAEGVEFSDGRVAMRWIGEESSVAIWPSTEAMLRVHGHDGRTNVVWVWQ